MFDKGKQLQSRIKLTEEILEFSKDKDSILLELPTGVGKNFNSFKLIEMFMEVGNLTEPRILISVPEIALIGNYEEDAKKLGFDHLLKYMKIICHASLHKEEGETYDFIVLDECHWVVSAKRVEAIKNIAHNKLIMLSATIDEKELKEFSKYTNYNRFELSLHSAIERGILPTPKIVVVNKNLDDTIPIYDYEERFGKNKKYTEKGVYEQISKDISYFREMHEGEPHNKFYKNKMLQLGSQRKRILGDIKHNTARRILNILPKDEKVITFCSSVNQAEDLGGKKAVCSSRRTKKTNREVIERFNKGEIKRIFVKDMLREGMNLHNCKYGIEIQMANKERDFLQKLGRVLRHDSPYFYVIRIPNTVDDRLIFNIPYQYITNYVNW